MKMHNADDADRFINHFRSVLTNICTIRGKKKLLLKKILVVGLIDSLSKTKSHDKKTHKKRYISFLDNYSNWVDKDRVSAQQIIVHPECSDRSTLFQLCNERVASWPEGIFLFPNSDPSYNESLKAASSDERKVVEDCTYKSLFYQYRCFLIHEFREPGKPLIESDESTPYYHSLSRVTSDEIHRDGFQLCFPFLFLTNIATNCIDTLATELQRNPINLRSIYKSSTSWHNS